MTQVLAGLLLVEASTRLSCALAQCGTSRTTLPGPLTGRSDGRHVLAPAQLDAHEQVKDEDVFFLPRHIDRNIVSHTTMMLVKFRPHVHAADVRRICSERE